MLGKLKQAKSKEELYTEIMKLSLPPFDEAWKREENLVSGCQSIMYLKSEMQGDKIFFYAYSDALISRGLAALLVHFYSGMTPEEVLKTPPTFINDLGIPELLTPGRANGLASLYLKIKKLTIAYIVASSS